MKASGRARREPSPRLRGNKDVLQTLSGLVDLSGDPDAPALRRPDGTVVARFAARGLRREAVEQEALKDLLGASLGQGAWPRSVGPRIFTP
jgi:hypothetical protein